MDVDEAIDEVEWRKTNYIRPHEYIVRDNNPAAFHVIAETIKKDSVVGEFLGRRYRYWFFKDYKYWQMGIIINRARIKPVLAA